MQEKEEMQEKMPKVGSKIKTPEGDGVVQYNNLLKGIVTVKVFQNEDNYKVQEFTLVELGLEKAEEPKVQEVAEHRDHQKQEQVKEAPKKVATDDTKVYNDNADKNVKVENKDSNEVQNGENPNGKNPSKNKHFGQGGFKKKKFAHHKNKEKKGDN